MANIDEGTVLGGRYEITGRIMASAQQDQVLMGRDQVLNREVLILVAARENASQAAQSARQLATGERSSSIQILDLGLSDNRTYLVAPGNSDVEDFLALLTNQDVYVEPFFTEHLGTEIFGEARQRTPETFDDDAEYYRELQDDLAEDDQDETKRPEFINKLSDRIDNWLNEETGEQPVVPGRPANGAGATGVGVAAAAASQSTQTPSRPTQAEPAEQTEAAQDDALDQTVVQEPITAQSAGTDTSFDDEQLTQVVPPITEEQAQAPVPVPPAPISSGPVEAAAPVEPAAERSRPFIPPPAAPQEPAADDGYAIEYTDEKPRSAAGRWLAGLLLVGILVAAVVFGFNLLDGDTEAPVANEPTETTAEEPAPEATEGEDTEPEPAGPAPVPASVQRIVPDSPGLSDTYETDLPAIIDGNQATAWHTLTFTTPQFGGFASNLALVVELEEQVPVSEITITQNQGSGGAFTVAVGNEPDPAGGVKITDGSFTGPEYKVDVNNTDGDPIEARYVIINFTELPTLQNTNSADRPYGLRIAEIDVN